MWSVFKRYWPSPAMIVAMVALGVGLAGTGGASVSVTGPSAKAGTATKASPTATGPRGPRGPRGFKGAKGDKGDTGSQGGQGPAGPAGASATALWAAVDFSGTIPRSSGLGSGSTKTGTGQYLVVFNKDVTGCVYQATSGGPTTGQQVADFGIGQKTGNPNALNVLALNSSGTALVDTSFYLTVFC